MDLNKVIICGRVTAKPELRATPNSQSVTTVGVATNRTWNDGQGQKQEEVEFHTVVVWGKTAEVACSYLDKGSLVIFEGRLKTRGWEDKQGAKHKATEIVCESMQLGPHPTSASPMPKEAEPEKPAAMATAPERPKENRVPLNGDEEDTGRAMKKLSDDF